MLEVQEKFPDIVIDHAGAIVKELGYHLHFPNGYTLSVQFGPGSYSDNYSAPIRIPGLAFQPRYGNELNMSPLTAEIAMWHGRFGEMMEFPDGDTVHGRTSYDDVMKIIEQIRGWGNPESFGEESVAELPPPPDLLQ